MASKILEWALLAVYAEILLSVMVYAVRCHMKDIYTSAYDDKLILSLITFSLMGGARCILCLQGKYGDIQYALELTMALTVLVCGIGLGIKLHNRLKNNERDSDRI